MSISPIWKELFQSYVPYQYPVGWLPQYTICDTNWCTGQIMFYNASNTLTDTVCKFTSLPFPVYLPERGSVLIQVLHTNNWIRTTNNHTIDNTICTPTLMGLACPLMYSTLPDDCSLQQPLAHCSLLILPDNVTGFIIPFPETVCVYNLTFTGCLYNVTWFTFGSRQYYLPPLDIADAQLGVKLDLSFFKTPLLDLTKLQKVLNTSDSLKQTLRHVDIAVTGALLRADFAKERLLHFQQQLIKDTFHSWDVFFGRSSTATMTLNWIFHPILIVMCVCLLCLVCTCYLTYRVHKIAHQSKYTTTVASYAVGPALEND
ncbi:uncharacterized protein LOC115075722 [Rhinatrema bivittatum]|uniref:uncharacterized protein LOC115075722 n=1 Tax=Rhinatrema bivittatum TaxID=194408 RepID=UPI001127BB3D|nr:uncharacterized protein LOC115075722 [Rhinatrema bivittatum]XP_029432252.1 uncharacterized protein LOC115075722 [Rhinatrema bivittatum]XP_029432253.1 uncharacterized protein LOC115075722 [Rhinatrema bivittatum]